MSVLSKTVIIDNVLNDPFWEHFSKTIAIGTSRPMATAALLVSTGQKSAVISETGLCAVRSDDPDRIRPFDDRKVVKMSEISIFS